MNSLNDLIWTKNEKIIPSIKRKLLEIADWVTKDLEDMVEIKDIYFTGSLATYKWTPTSDVDLHIIIDVKEKICDEPVEEYLELKSKLFNKEHNIFIKGYKVEVNMKDKETKLKGKGIYDLLKDNWVIQPTKVTRTVKDPDVIKKADKFKQKIDLVVTQKRSLDDVESLKKEIKKMRVDGLQKEGEYSVGNLAFKVLRNSGYLGKIFDYKAKLIDDSLSLESFRTFFTH
jgi:predicted nucleotidyltransferase